MTDRIELRKIFFQAWAKQQIQAGLTPLEQQLVTIITQHPEYHLMLNNPAKYLAYDYHDEPNPFLHLAGHLSLCEQVSTDRPAGIRQIYQQLCAKVDYHTAEHTMMDCLLQIMWAAQAAHTAPDAQVYISKLSEIVADLR